MSAGAIQRGSTVTQLARSLTGRKASVKRWVDEHDQLAAERIQAAMAPGRKVKRDFSPTVTFGIRSPGRLSPIAETSRSGGSKASTLINTSERSPAASESAQSPPVPDHLGQLPSTPSRGPLDFDPESFAVPPGESVASGPGINVPHQLSGAHAEPTVLQPSVRRRPYPGRGRGVAPRGYSRDHSSPRSRGTSRSRGNPRGRNPYTSRGRSRRGYG
ncbi:hypothetical protein B0A48_18215 [Cryoendolithus antarcticus]|uniref:Uncharacterized protein n=1 Tax=Cryoendolithus antarcticus TaxID=1507870 RepID=A0A1V8SA05_9PEZI|nr:hypothetical protein B0A48_18215 [Cryoendolithus antarcticus]